MTSLSPVSLALGPRRSRFPFSLFSTARSSVYRRRLTRSLHSLSIDEVLRRFSGERNKVYTFSAALSVPQVVERSPPSSFSHPLSRFLLSFLYLSLYPSMRDSFRRYSAAASLVQSRSPFNLCVRVSAEERLANGRSLNRSHATSSRRSGGFMSLRYARAFARFAARDPCTCRKNQRSSRERGIRPSTRRSFLRSFYSIRDDDRI